MSRSTWLAALLLAAAACSGREVEEAASQGPRATPVPVVVDDTPRPVAAPSAGSSEVVGLQRQVIALQSQLQEAKEQADYYQGEAARFQRGLDKCVGELNRVAGEAAAAPAYAPSAPRRAAQARVHTLGAPRVQIIGDSAVVTVKVWNAGDGAAAGNVDLELVLNGQVVDSASEWVEISPRTDQVVTATFYVSPSEGTYSARARLGF